MDSFQKLGQRLVYDCLFYYVLGTGATPGLYLGQASSEPCRGGHRLAICKQHMPGRLSPALLPLLMSQSASGRINNFITKL